MGTSNGAEGDMLRSILEDVKTNGFKVEQLVMDHDTSGCNVACDVFPEIQITYCGNHSAKTGSCEPKSDPLQGSNIAV